MQDGPFGFQLVLVYLIWQERNKRRIHLEAGTREHHRGLSQSLFRARHIIIYILYTRVILDNDRWIRIKLAYRIYVSTSQW